ncbi:hypothetical protein CEXT_773741 [Caerostris extrusa]|uniref:Uncharacterized protein n=1 Tax=Caerostris extrusa TaxID=172846 RepID=A0AAV4RNA4_CAEEX|nr:hypothetical protein CEXT_773741 [Caerostris extrusa]
MFTGSRVPNRMQSKSNKNQKKESKCTTQNNSIIRSKNSFVLILHDHPSLLLLSLTSAGTKTPCSIKCCLENLKKLNDLERKETLKNEFHSKHISSEYLLSYSGEKSKFWGHRMTTDIGHNIVVGVYLKDGPFRQEYKLICSKCIV